MPLAVERSAELTTRLMGSELHVITVGDGPEPVDLVEELAALEGRWSRFDPNSELSRIGAVGGRPCVASPETAELVWRCHVAWQRTGGRFDPTVIEALETLGYDCDFARIAGRTPLVPPTPHRPARPARGLSGTLVDQRTGLVQLPAGVRIDPGGLGKGLAADLVACAAVRVAQRDGSPGYGVLVSVGGDLRVAGAEPSDGWEIEIDHEVGVPACVNLRQGAIATSSVLRRRWISPSGPCHHVVDPATGLPVEGPVVGATVIAAEAWWAEVLATVLLVDSTASFSRCTEELFAEAGALLTFEDGSRATVGPLAGAFGQRAADRRSGDGRTREEELR